MLVLPLQSGWILRVELFYSLSPKWDGSGKWPSWNAAMVQESPGGVAGAHEFAVMLINYLIN